MTSATITKENTIPTYVEFNQAYEELKFKNLDPQLQLERRADQVLKKIHQRGGDVGLAKAMMSNKFMMQANHASPETLAKAEEFAKANTFTTGTVNANYYDLRTVALNLYPVNTPGIKECPETTTTGRAGIQHNWKQYNSITGSGIDTDPGVPEGTRAGVMGTNLTDVNAAYKTVAEETALTQESINAGLGFDDNRAVAARQALQKLMLKKENVFWGGNNNLALGAATVTAAIGSTTAGALGTGAYIIRAAYLGWSAMRLGSVANGLPLPSTVTSQDSAAGTFTVNGGVGQISAGVTVTTANGTSTITASVPYKLGMYGVAWFASPTAGSAAGNEVLWAITTTNKYTFLGTETQGTQLASAFPTDKSTNQYIYNGLLTQALKTGSGATIISLNGATSGYAQTTLTSDGAGGIVEWDACILGMWNSNQVNPTEMWMSANTYKKANKLIVANGGAPLLRQWVSSSQAPDLAANPYVTVYFSAYNTSGPYGIRIRIHPFFPDGCVAMIAKNLPEQFQQPNIPTTYEMLVRADYQQIDWNAPSRSDQIGVYREEVLALYAPFCVGIVNNFQ